MANTAARADSPGGSAPSPRFDDPSWGRVSGDEQRMLEAAEPSARGACTERRSKVTRSAGSWRQSRGPVLQLLPRRVCDASVVAIDRLILFGEGRLFRALDEFVAHYHGERNHQGLGNELITPAAAAAGETQVRCRDRLGGLLRYYHRAA
jgi:hypothetical protein